MPYAVNPEPWIESHRMRSDSMLISMVIRWPSIKWIKVLTFHNTHGFREQIIRAANGELNISLSQDIVSGIYSMTQTEEDGGNS